MYHNKELSINKFSISNHEYESPEPYLNKTKIRFVELEIGDEFDYYGELLTKQNRYNAISVRNRNKKQYLFFGNEIVYVDNKKEDSKESNSEEIIGDDEQLDGIDKVIKNFQFKKSSLNLIHAPNSGLPNSVKTTTALYLASYFIKNNHKVLFLQHKMRYIDIINKIKRLTKLENPQENIHIFSIPIRISYKSILKNIESISNLYDVIIYDGIYFKDVAIYRNEFVKSLYDLSIVNNNTTILIDYYFQQLYSLNYIFSTIYTIEKKSNENTNLELLFTKQKNRYNHDDVHQFSCNLSLDYLKG